MTNILRRRQVLFKVHVPPRPSEPANETFFVLSEGEREGEIEVLEIDERAGTARFNNHGSVETLSLKNNTDHPK